MNNSDLARILWMYSASALLLLAADPSWRTKPIDKWTEEDANQVLTASPWAMEVRAGIARRLSEDELREGGEMGQHHGVGYDGVDPGSGPHLPADIIHNNRSIRSTVRDVKIKLRWESALPVRAAGLKAHEMEPPTVGTDGYSIAVYGVPGTYFKGDPIHLGDPLKKQASLKRDGKKDVKPSGVEVFQGRDGLIVVYLFPLSAEITKKDRRVDFEAHIGRVFVMQSFDLAQMEFMGKLEL